MIELHTPRLLWSADYVGLPWRDLGRDRAGIDCWGAVWLPFRDLHGIELPRYTEQVAGQAERAEIAALFERDAGRWPWRPVVRTPQLRERAFDIAVFRVRGWPTHFGLVVAAGRMLHILEHGTSRVDRFDTGVWATKLAGLYRHAALEAAA